MENINNLFCLCLLHYFHMFVAYKYNITEEVGNAWMTYLVSNGLNVMFEPSFVSNWYVAIAQNESLSLLTIFHNLGEYPVKVDVQVKINDGGEEYIFTGLGSSQTDDDYPEEYGGVIYIYNKEYVNISFPCKRNDYPSGSLGYTGSNSLYTGPSNLGGSYYYGVVRIRAWLASDMPQIVLNESVFMDNINNYKEIKHGLGFYPDVVTVQTLLPNGYMSDGIGVVFRADARTDHNDLTGVLFGYDNNQIRLWVPSLYQATSGTGGVFGANDGYRLGYEVGGTVRIMGWSIECKQQVFYKKFTVGDGVAYDSTVEFPCTYDLTNYFVSVQYTVNNVEPPNGGMVFSGAGTTQGNSGINYGGIIYVYTEHKLMLWRPKNRPVVFIGERWGNGQSSQISNTSEVIIRVFSLPLSECPYPEMTGNATLYVSGVKYGHIVTYICNAGYTHVGGNLLRMCGRNRRWSGVIPQCSACQQVSVINYQTNSTLNLGVILSQIRVNKKNTSANYRKLTSAHDGRWSSFVIGMFAVSLLVAVVSLLVLPDLIAVCRHVFLDRRNNRNKAE